jgi:hypothetical protein
MVFEERPEVAERLLRKERLTAKRAFSEAAQIIRYLRFLNYSEDQILDVVIPLLAELYKVPSRDDMVKCYKSCSKVADRLIPIRTDPVRVSIRQIDEIRKIGNPDIERFIFTALCIYNYYKVAKTEYVVKVSEAQKASGIRGGKKLANMSALFPYVDIRILKNEAYVMFSPEFLAMNEPEYLEINNCVNISYYYEEFIGRGKYIHCKNCGAIELRNSKARKFCMLCSDQNHKKWRRRSKNPETFIGERLW